MPEGSKAMCIKNRLMRRAAAGTPWAGTKDYKTLELALLKYYKTCGPLLVRGASCAVQLRARLWARGT